MAPLALQAGDLRTANSQWKKKWSFLSSPLPHRSPWDDGGLLREVGWGSVRSGLLGRTQSVRSSI